MQYLQNRKKSFLNCSHKSDLSVRYALFQLTVNSIEILLNRKKKRSYTHYDPRKTGQNFRIEQTLVSRLNAGKKSKRHIQ